MSNIQHLIIEGHTIAAQALNPGATGEPVILIHGIGGSIHFWGDDQTAPFRKQGPCYSLSLPGHYPAVFPPNFKAKDISAEMMARVLGQAIRELVGDQPVTLAGMSTGGFAVLALAALMPELARRVICISGFAQGRWGGLFAPLQLLVRHGLPGRTIFQIYYPFARVSLAAFRAAWSVYPADARAMYSYPHFDTCTLNCYYDFKRMDMRSIAHYFNIMPDIDILDQLEQINVPMLVMAGTRDPIVPPVQAELIAAHVPNAELRMIPGAGHLLFAERPEPYQQALEEWLGRTTLSQEPQSIEAAGD